MEGNENPDDVELKFARNVSDLDDDEEENGDGSTIIMSPTESEEFHQTDDMQCIRPKNAIPFQDEDTSFINVGLQPVARKTTKETLRYLDQMPKTGTSGCMLSTERCKPLKGNYAEGMQFEKIRQYTSKDTRRVNKCVDLSTKKAFIRKEILKTKFNKNEAIVPIDLKHSNIQAVIGVIQRDHSDSLWVELLLEDAGRSLEDFVRAQPPLLMKVVWDICVQGLQALKHIHQHGITHHDVKPENFTIDAEGNVRLIDFGSLRLPYKQVSLTGGWTPEYLPPECCRYLLARSEPGLSCQITTKVDVFAFAMLMGFLVTGKHLLIGLVTPNCEYLTGQREGLRDNLIKKIIENPEEIRDLISKTINNESLRVLLQTMSHEDVKIRDSAKDALVKVTELRQIDQPTNPKKTDKVMVEELDKNDEVFSTKKLKRRGPALQHPCIRTQESTHKNNASRDAYMFEMSQQHQLDVQTSSELKKKGPRLEYRSIRKTKHVPQIDLKQAEELLSEGSTVIQPKYRKANKPASGKGTPLFQASYAPCMAEQNVSERQENDEQQKINHDEVLLKLKTSIATRQQQKKEPTPLCFGRNCNNGRVNEETGTKILPRFHLLLSSDSFKE